MQASVLRGQLCGKSNLPNSRGLGQAGLVETIQKSAECLLITYPVNNVYCFLTWVSETTTDMHYLPGDNILLHKLLNAGDQVTFMGKYGATSQFFHSDE